MDTTGLMAPVPSRARAEYERKKRLEPYRKAAEVLSYVPGPLGDVAEVAGNVMDKGPLVGLMASWDVVALPKILKNAPGKLSWYERTAPPSGRHPKPGTDDARELFYKTGKFQDAHGNWLQEFPDTGLRQRPQLAEAVQIAASRAPGTMVSGQVKDFIEHPELFRRFPQIPEQRLNIVSEWDPANTGAGFHPTNKEYYLFTNPNKPIRASSIAHEFQHNIQNLQGLPGGSNPRKIMEELAVAVDKQSKALPPDVQKALARSELMKELDPASRLLYDVTSGEVGARLTGERVPLTAGERRQVYFYDTPDPYGHKLSLENHIENPLDPEKLRIIARALIANALLGPGMDGGR